MTLTKREIELEQKVAELSAQAREVPQLRAKTAVLQKERDKLLQQLGLIESLDRGRIAVPDWIAPPKPVRGHHATLCLLVTDTHFDEVVNPDEVDGINCYNREIAELRLRRCFERTIMLARDYLSGIKYDGVALFLGGDVFSGNIHEELEVTNEQPITEALVRMSYALYDFGRSLAETVPNVTMIVMPGNHPRLERKPRMKNAWNNFEWAMGMFVQALAHDTFTVVVPKDLVHRFTIFDQTIGLSHGDGVKSQSFAGVPWYSMKQRRDAIQALLKSLSLPQIDLLVYGHYHQMFFEEGSGSSLLVNGSIKGYDEYILKTKYSGQTPIQALLTFHPTHGLTDLSRINLGSVK